MSWWVVGAVVGALIVGLFIGAVIVGCVAVGVWMEEKKGKGKR